MSDYQNLDECSGLIDKSLKLLQMSKEKYEDGLLVLHSLQSNPQFNLQLKEAMEYLFEGLKILSDLQIYLQTKGQEKYMAGDFLYEEPIKEIKDEKKYDDLNVKVEIQDDMERKTQVVETPSQCSFICDNEQNLSKHMNTHKQLKAMKDGHKCDLCHRTFSTVRQLSSHKKRYHKVGTKHLCNTCGLTFKNRKELSNHQRQEHSTNFPGNTESSENQESDCDMNEVTTSSEIPDKFPDPLESDIHSEIQFDHFDVTESLQSLVQSSPQSSKVEISDQQGEETSNRTIEKCQTYTETKESDKPFQCGFCDKEFSERSQLNAHLIGYHKTKPYKCAPCDLSFRQKENFDDHTIKVHRSSLHTSDLILPEENELKTENRIIEYDSGEIENTVIDELDNAKNYKVHRCPECEAQYKSPVLLREHLLRHFLDNPYWCDWCGQQFKGSNLLKKHRKEVHASQEESETTKLSNENKENLSDRGIRDKKLACRLCSKAYSSLPTFKSHIKDCSKKNFAVELDHFEDVNVKVTKSEHNCDQCGKHFSSKDILNQHRILHGDFRFACDCGKKFKKKKLYTRHIKTHQGDRPYKCDQCPRDYLDMASLRGHQIVHSGETGYKCEVCDKEFFYAQSFKYHMRHHNGDKPFTCEICGKAFTQKSNLKNHMKIHTGEKPFKCEICGKDFARKTDLGHHSKTHTGERPFKCDQCGMTFARSGRLSAHIRSHTGERPFKCLVCNKTFREKSGLNRHSMIHTGKRPHKCDVCGLGFIQSGALNSHKKSQHPPTTQGPEEKHRCVLCAQVFLQESQFQEHLKSHVNLQTS